MNNKYWNWLFLILILVFIGFKIPTLNTPLYQDEQSLVVATLFLSESSFQEFTPYAGHPPLITILLLGFMKLFPWRLIYPHIISLAFSILALIYFFKIIDHFRNKKLAFFGACLLATTPLFFTQAGILNLDLPGLSLVLTAYFYYLKNKKSLFVLFSTLALLTKETTGIIITLILAFDFFSKVKSIKQVLPYIKKNYEYLIPYFSLLIWILFCKISYGWFIYPVHGSYFFRDGDWWKTIIEFVFFKNKRLLLLPFIFIGLISKNLRKEKFLLLTIVIFNMLFFANIFLGRYTIIIIPFYLLLFFISIPKSKLVLFISILLIFINIFNIYPDSNTLTNGEEYNMNYLNVISFHKQGVELMNKEYPNGDIFSLWPINQHFNHPQAGYLDVHRNTRSFYDDEYLNETLLKIAFSSSLEDPWNHKRFIKILDEQNFIPKIILTWRGDSIVIYEKQ